MAIKQFHDRDKAMLAADSLLKHSNVYMLCTMDSAGGNYIADVSQLNVMGQLGFWSYVKMRAEIELDRIRKALNE